MVLGATGLSVGALVLAVQTPGISQFFGCRPLGPIGWSTAVAAAGGATTASIVLPWTAELVGRTVVRAGQQGARRLTSSSTDLGRSA